MYVWQAVERFSPFPLYSKVYRRGTGNIPRAGMGLPLLSGRVEEINEVNVIRTGHKIGDDIAAIRKG